MGRKIVNDKNVEYAHVDYEPKDAEYLKSAKGSASYREIKEWIKEQHDVSVSNLYIATVYKGNIIKNLIMDCQSYTKYRPNETTGGIFVSWRRKEELPTGA